MLVELTSFPLKRSKTDERLLNASTTLCQLLKASKIHSDLRKTVQMNMKRLFELVSSRLEERRNERVRVALVEIIVTTASNFPQTLIKREEWVTTLLQQFGSNPCQMQPEFTRTVCRCLRALHFCKGEYEQTAFQSLVNKLVSTMHYLLIQIFDVSGDCSIEDGLLELFAQQNPSLLKSPENSTYALIFSRIGFLIRCLLWYVFLR